MKFPNLACSQRKNRIRCGALLIFLVSNTPLFAGSAIQPISIVDPLPVTPTGGSGDSLAPIISSNGRYVLFASSANNLTLNNSVNLTPSPTPAVMNVYLRDRVKQTTTLVSVSLGGNGAGNGDSIPAGISTNGQFVLFESAANNLVANDTNGVNDVFVRDLVANATTLVSVTTNGGVANGTSRSSVITPDGRYVAFVSSASNLTPGDTNGIPDVLVRDLQAGTTTLVSAGAMPYSAASSSELPLITPNGRYVTFYSTATNLVAGVTNSGEIYVRDLLQGQTAWASTNTALILQSLGTKAIRSCNQAISDDGQSVVYEACPLNGNGFVLRYNLASGLTDIVNTNVAGILTGLELNERNLSMTPDGRFVAVVANENGVNTGITVWDSLSNATIIASADLTQTPVTNSIFDWPAITPDGRFVAFVSDAPNLTPNPVAAGFHLYVRDLQAGINTLVDADTNGAGSTAALMTFPRLSDDGSVVAFESPDGSLVANDNNRAYDVFARNLSTGSTELISVSLPGLPSLTPNASCEFSSGCVSTDGRYLVFWSDADNLKGVDTSGLRELFIRDLVGGTNYLVNVNTNGISDNSPPLEAAITGNGQYVAFASPAVISGNGRYVAFTSSATDLVTNAINSGTNVFLRDMQAGTTELVSVSTDSVTPGNAASYSPTVSTDGSTVLFCSLAGNLVPESSITTVGNLYWRNMQSGTNRAITAYGSSITINSAMTPNGQRVAYSSQNVSYPTTTVYVWDATTNKNIYTYVSSIAISKVAISPDGNWVAFYTTNLIVLTNLVSKTGVLFSNSFSRAECQFSADSQSFAYVGGTNQIYLYNSTTGSNVLVSAGANGICDSPTISADGRFVAYRSYAANLTVNDTNGVPNIFLYDSQADTTFMVTANPFGSVAANGRSLNPVFSGDGQTLFWESWANNLAGQDFNQWCNIYALKSFTTNSLSGAGQPSSITAFGLSSLAAFGSSAGAATLAWPASVGTTYQVQFTTNLANPQWQVLTNAVEIFGTQGYAVDYSTNNSQRFYRLVAY